MSFYTLITKTVQCHMWNDSIKITAKYRYIEDSENPYMACFVKATCEVIENSKLPPKQRDKRLAWYQFCRIDDCHHLRDFPETTDTRLNPRDI